MKGMLVLVLWTMGALAHATAWKCQIEGKTVFSDKPCPEQGRPVDTTSGQNAGFTGPRDELLRERARSVADDNASAPAGRSPGSLSGMRAPGPTQCPSAQEMSNLRVSLSAKHLNPEQQFSAELEAAERCHRGLGRYTAADWAALRELRTDKSSVDERTRQRAAAREGAIYRVADPELAAQWAEQRAERERLRALQQRRAQRGAWPPEPVTCTPVGCQGADGFYTRTGAGQVTGPKGSCRVIGSLMHC
jgi:hypothetical protein